MRMVIQRVDEASVTVDGQITGSIGQGFLVLLGVSDSDTREIADKMVHKLLGMRIFRDDNGKINRSLADVGGALLVVSQFTLYADCRKGNRPSFTAAGGAQMANDLYEYVVESCRNAGYHTETGIFGADMDVRMLNQGPFTIILDSEDLA